MTAATAQPARGPCALQATLHVSLRYRLSNAHGAVRRSTRTPSRCDPDSNNPENLLVQCSSRHCEFGRGRYLPIVAVDEPIYARLPAFMIATADKFAALPWSGETARFFRGGDPADPRPPDLIIQDELHLISGPLGTMAGLYETAIDQLCKRQIGDTEVRP